jgi:hypothetical protein
MRHYHKRSAAIAITSILESTAGANLTLAVETEDAVALFIRDDW